MEQKIMTIKNFYANYDTNKKCNIESLKNFLKISSKEENNDKKIKNNDKKIRNNNDKQIKNKKGLQNYCKELKKRRILETSRKLNNSMEDNNFKSLEIKVLNKELEDDLDCIDTVLSAISSDNNEDENTDTFIDIYKN